MTMPTIKPRVIEYEMVSYMQVVTARDNKKYYTLGVMSNMKNTLAVTEVHGNGGQRFFCVEHNIAYTQHENCSECRNKVVDVPTDASVTGCYTPEIER